MPNDPAHAPTAIESGDQFANGSYSWNPIGLIAGAGWIRPS